MQNNSKHYQLSIIDSSIEIRKLILQLSNLGKITNYCYEYFMPTWERKTVLLRSELSAKELQHEILKVSKSRFFLVEINLDNYGGLLSPLFWSWVDKSKERDQESKKVEDDPKAIKDENIDVLEDILPKNDSGTQELTDKEENIIDVEFNKLIGLSKIKTDLKSFQDLLLIQKEREKRKLGKSTTSLHAVFSGPPGTGKTTVARILGKIYKELNLLKKGHVVEVDRGDLVAGFIGHTATKTKEKLNEALDGILFIDEAYALSSSSDIDFGKEAIETILKFMEDYRDRISIIVAGYENKMENFIDSNPGLKSRFTRHYDFPSFSPNELSDILKIYMKDENYTIKDNPFSFLQRFIKEYKNKADPLSFGNARSIRNIFEDLKLIHSTRIATVNNIKSADDSIFTEFLLRDVTKLYKKHNFTLRKNKK